MKHFEIHADGEHQTTWRAPDARTAALEWAARHKKTNVTAKCPKTGETATLGETVTVNEPTITPALFAPELPPPNWFKRVVRIFWS